MSEVQDRTDAAETQAPVVFTLEKTGKYQGALFNIKEEDLVEGGPIMSGSIEVNNVRVSLSAFLEESANTGTKYLNLSLGSKGGVHYYGRLFRQAEKRSERSPDYSGFILLLPAEPGAPKYTNEQWDKAERLQVYGRRVKNLSEGSRISLDVVPQRSREPVAEGELSF